MRPAQPSVVADRHHVMRSTVPSSGRVNTMIRITGIGDHDRLEWLIRINGIRMRNASAGLAALDGKKYLNLETYRKSGKGVRTPVWFAAARVETPVAYTLKLYVHTPANSGKAKRVGASLLYVSHRRA